jgi:exonuclease VII large subunit
VTPLAQITAVDKGKQVTVQATVVGTENFSDGFKLTINDATAQAILLIWADDWDYVYSNYHLNVGAVVSTTGKVDVYRNQIEIIPDHGRDVQVVKWAKRDWRKYDLGAINGNDHNAVVWVEGTIADIQSSSDGTYLVVGDATGAQKVRLYDVVARRIPQREKLYVGQSVSVVGRVRARRRVGVEITVALPQDIYVPASLK